MAYEGILNCLPFPRITKSGDLVDGILMDSCDFCMNRCETRECARYECGVEGEAIYHTCPHGFSVVCARCSGVEFRVCGVLHLASSTATKEFKKAQRSRKLSSESIDKLLSSMGPAIRQYEDDIRSKSRDELASIHEIKSQIGVVFRIVEDYIYANYGGYIDSKIEIIDPVWKNLQAALRRLRVLLDLTDLVVNPQAAKFGQKIHTQIHQTVFSIVKTIEAKASSLGVNVTLAGTSYNQLPLYRSFPIVISILLDNALKYAQHGTEVLVIVNDLRNYGVEIRVSSIGKVVPDEDRGSMFEKNVRGANSIGKEGSGIGLYVAKLVCDANNARIEYIANEYSSEKGFGENLFKITIKT